MDKLHTLHTLQELLQKQRECIQRIERLLEDKGEESTNEQHNGRASEDRAKVLRTGRGYRP